MPQTDSEQLTWLFIGLACLTFLVMMLFNVLARRKSDQTGAKLTRSKPQPHRERVAARSTQSGALPPIPAHLRPKVPQKPLFRGPGRPSVWVLEGVRTHKSLLLLQRADALEAEGHAPGVVRLTLEGNLEKENILSRWLADRAQALAWEPDGTLACDVWWVSLSATASKEEPLDANAAEPTAPTGPMENVDEVDTDESVLLRALDNHGQPMGEAVSVPFKKAELSQVTAQLFAHDEAGVMEILESVRTRIATLETLGNCDGALRELPQWLETLTQLLLSQARVCVGDDAVQRENCLGALIREVQQKKTELLKAETVNFEVLCVAERIYRLALLERTVFNGENIYEQMLVDASNVVASEKQLETLAGYDDGCMKADATEVVALIDHRMVSLGHCARLLVRFD